jgi:polycystin 1L2
LGNLVHLKIWHDNSGHGNKASWYLKHIIVRDLQKRESFFFKCEQWMAVEKGDGKLERELVVTRDTSQNIEIKYLKNAENSLLDMHLWLSVFYKPVQSTFTRLDRVTCCFVSHYLSMALCILYYDSTSSGVNNINFVFFNISMQMVYINNSYKKIKELTIKTIFFYFE